MRTFRQKKRRGGKSFRTMYDEHGDLIEPMSVDEFRTEVSYYICKNVSDATRTEINTYIQDVYYGRVHADVNHFIRALVGIFLDFEPRNLRDLRLASHIPLHEVLPHLLALSCLNNKSLSTDKTFRLMKKLILVTNNQRRRKLLHLLETDTSNTVYDMAKKIEKHFAFPFLTQILEGNTSKVNVNVIRTMLLQEFDQYIGRKRKAHEQFESPRPAPNNPDPFPDGFFPDTRPAPSSRFSYNSRDSLSTHFSRDVLTNRSYLI